MKKCCFVLMVLVFVFNSISHAGSYLIGQWQFKEKIGTTVFTDLITITKVSAVKRKVSGFWTQYPTQKISGYFYNNVVFIEPKGSDLFLDGWFFTFEGTPSFGKHHSVISFFHDFDTSWEKLAATKLSNSTAAASVTAASKAKFESHQIQKRDALLREKRDGQEE